MAASSDHVSLKLRDKADTQICWTGCVGTDDELRRRGLLEHELQDAVVQLDLEVVLVGQRQQVLLQFFERLVGAEPEFLIRHGVDVSRSADAT